MRAVLTLAGLFALFIAVALAWAIQQFVVFFLAGDVSRLDPEQWRVTDEGLSVVEDAADAYRGFGGFILLIGGDHNVGSAEDALERSRRRAEAVKDALVARGVPAEAITTKACGYSAPLVEAPPGTKEPMNRFVLFSFEVDRTAVAERAATACVPRPGRL